MKRTRAEGNALAKTGIDLERARRSRATSERATARCSCSRSSPTTSSFHRRRSTGSRISRSSISQLHKTIDADQQTRNADHADLLTGRGSRGFTTGRGSRGFTTGRGSRGFTTGRGSRGFTTGRGSRGFTTGRGSRGFTTGRGSRGFTTGRGSRGSLRGLNQGSRCGEHRVHIALESAALREVGAAAAFTAEAPSAA